MRSDEATLMARVGVAEQGLGRIQQAQEKEHILEITQHDLSESKEEIEDLVQQLEDSKAEKAVLNTEALYQRIVDTKTNRHSVDSSKLHTA